MESAAPGSLKATLNPGAACNRKPKAELLLYFLIYFLAVVGLNCCIQFFSSYGEWGLLFVAVCRLLIAVASPVEHRL